MTRRNRINADVGNGATAEHPKPRQPSNPSGSKQGSAAATGRTARESKVDTRRTKRAKSPPKPNVPMRRTTASADLLRLVGHKDSCIRLTKSGKVASCDCQVKPIEDPAVTVALAVHFAQMALAQNAALPAVIVELLSRRIREGDDACLMVADWLGRKGLVAPGRFPSRRKRSQ